MNIFFTKKCYIDLVQLFIYIFLSCEEEKKNLIEKDRLSFLFLSQLCGFRFCGPSTSIISGVLLFWSVDLQ